MSIDTIGGPASVAARISEIESMLGVRPAAAAGATAVTTATTATTSAVTSGRSTGRGAFSGVLTRALAASDGTAATAATGAATGTASAGGAADAGRRAVDLARSYTGTPYRWGGTDPAVGLDCSGLTQLVYRQLGVELPRVSRDQARVGERVASLDDARPGDLVFFGSPVHHVGIYAGDGKMVDAPRRGRTVGLHDVWSDVTAIRRVLPAAPEPSAAGQLQGLATAPVGALAATSPEAALLAAAGAGTGAGTGATTVNALLAAARGYGASAPGGILGQAGSRVVGVPAGWAAAGATAGSAVSSVAPSVAPTAPSAVPSAATRADAAWAAGPYADLFRSAGARYGVDPALLSAVAKAESGYRAGARSHAGAIGLMQIMPGTARELGVDPTVPAQAVDGAARLLADHLETYDGRVDLALAAYNAGPGAVRRHGGVPPYAETQQYVRRVTAFWEDLR